MLVATPRGRGQDDVRRHNLAALLGLVHRWGAATRADVTRSLQLNRSTVGDLVGVLVDAGLLVEERPADLTPGRVGRPSLQVRPRPVATGGTSVLAVQVDVHDLQVVRVGLGGTVLARWGSPTSPTAGPEAVVQLVADAARRLCGQDAQHVAGIALAVPGTVHAATGVVASAPHLGWREVPLRDLVAGVLATRGGLALPVQVANDADLGLLAEQRRGAAVDHTDVVYLSGTHGLGGGVLTGGHPLTGHRGFGGEVGHIGVDPAGRACHCGSRGCWEAQAMAGAWAELFELDPGAPDVVQQVLARLRAGGVVSRRTRDKLSRSFAGGLASLVNVFDPQVVLLGDGLWRELWPEVAGDVLPWLERFTTPVLRSRVAVRPAGLGRDSTLLGAAELAFAPLLADPLGSLAGRWTPAGLVVPGERGAQG
ncbi:ROK family protein [Kineococcus arenarius]|uniref:ROK family protein n=1 Tax=Kineococcus sp. SYSU DK007 TaxID=3383128 RepID=UPI003D7CE05C